MEATPDLTPLLVVRGAAAAIDFYVRALSAQVVARFEHGEQRRISHADLLVGSTRFSLTEELRRFNADAPPSLGGSPVVLQLFVPDTARAFASMCDAGATALFAPQDLLGERMARVRDPFGHLWLLRQRLVELSAEEQQRQRDELVTRWAALEDAPSLSPTDAPAQARVHLVVGPVGAGKSTFAQRLAAEHRAVRFTLDDWMGTLFRPDRPEQGVIPWYTERAQRCIEQIWKQARPIVESGRDAILEIGLLTRSERQRFLRRLDEAGTSVTVYVLDAERDVRRERVLERNRVQGSTFSMVVPERVFELASDLWEPVGALESEGRDVRFFRTDVQSPSAPSSVSKVS